MQYHIQTTPIWDNFKKNCGCAMCGLERETEARFIDQYSAEGVMEPVYRVRVNKTGFCTAHLAALFDGKNKLGTALQVNTRTAAIIDGLELVYTSKAAKKQASALLATLNTCVICEEVESIMLRYAETTAQMFRYEREFPKLFEYANGFCVRHYALLLGSVRFAGPMEKQYAATLSKVQITRMKKDNETLERFIGRYDYNSKDKFSSDTDDALKNSVNRLKGDGTVR